MYRLDSEPAEAARMSCSGRPRGALCRDIGVVMARRSHTPAPMPSSVVPSRTISVGPCFRAGRPLRRRRAARTRAAACQCMRGDVSCAGPARSRTKAYQLDDGQRLLRLARGEDRGRRCAGCGQGDSPATAAAAAGGRARAEYTAPAPPACRAQLHVHRAVDDWRGRSPPRGHGGSAQKRVRSWFAITRRWK